MIAQLSGPRVQSASHERNDRYWQVTGQNKVTFFQSNRAAFTQVIEEVNSALATQYGHAFAPLTLEDVEVIYMVEAGISAAGKVDPTFVHSNGEVGLLPLPRNIQYWTDLQAPAFDQLSDIDVNISHYLAYLGALKNMHVKTVAGLALYRDLFADPQIASSPADRARLLAGVVHGYFWEGNYAAGTIPLGHLLEGYQAGTSVPDLTRSTSYVHAGKPLLDGRQRNIDAALRQLV